MPIHDTALVVPSIREESFRRFCKEWAATGLLDRVDLVLVEDNPTSSFGDQRPASCGIGGFYQIAWDSIDKHGWSWIIPRRSDTVRSFGYWWVWQQGYEYLMTLDDDCYPAKGYEELDLMHKSMLTRTRWFNTLNNVRPRGFPYFNTGKRDVHVNHGLWQGVLDYDAPQQLVTPTPEVYTHDNRIVPHGAYHPFCGMNAMWRRDAIPLSYHLLMGQVLVGQPSASNGPHYSLDRLPFDRFGDIWCGIIQKKVCDHLGWAVSSGTPYIHHDRASNPFTNLRKEANGIEVNEWFWEKIDAVTLPDVSEFPNEEWAAICYRYIADAVLEWDGEHREYWRKLGSAMETWAELFLPDPMMR
jgi:reversibly glycosylated polypeptide / UDP-arabinopyranose mutase